MVRLYLFVEGQTEQTFANNLLRDHLAQYGSGLSIMLIAHCYKKGVAHRGGGSKYQPMHNDIVRLLKQEKKSDVYFSTMIDLYALMADFPGQAEAEKHRDRPIDRVKSLECAFEKKIDDPRFIAYLQLHEFEAYLFSGVEKFLTVYPDSESKIRQLKRIAEAHETPEFINDGQHTAPSKRIISEFPEYKGGKSNDGPLIAARIGLRTIREACPHFNEWLTRLEALGSQS